MTNSCYIARDARIPEGSCRSYKPNSNPFCLFSFLIQTGNSRTRAWEAIS